MNARNRFISLAVRARHNEAEVEELVGLFEALGEETCRSEAKRNHVEALVGHTLQRCLPGKPLSEDWSEFIARNGRRVSNLVASLSEIVERLEAEGIQSAVIENGGTLLGSDLAFEAFDAKDLDLLIQTGKLSDAYRICEALGFRSEDRRARPTNRIEIKRELVTGEEQWLGLAEVPFDRMWLPLGIEDRSSVWLGRRVEAKRSERLSVLEATDAAVLITFHTSLHSFIRAPGVRLHTDLDQLVTVNTIDWNRFVEEARSIRGGNRVYVSLKMAKSLLGTEIPDQVIRTLCPGGMRARLIEWLLERDGVFVNDRRKLGRASAILLDFLIFEGGLGKWLWTACLPDPSWMREHFDRERRGLSIWRLHLKRTGGLLKRWNPM